MKETLVYSYIKCQGMLLLLHSVSFRWRALVSQRSSSYHSPQREQEVLDLNPKTCNILPNLDSTNLLLFSLPILQQTPNL